MKKLLFLLSLSSLFACQAKTDQNKILIENYYKQFNEHNWEAMAELYVDSAEMKDPSIGIENIKMSKADIVAKYTELEKMIPDVRDSIINTYSMGNNVVVEFVSTGTAPDGTTFKLPICTVFEIKDGKITKDLTYYDN